MKLTLPYRYDFGLFGRSWSVRAQRSVEIAMSMVRFISAAMASVHGLLSVRSARQMGTGRGRW